MPEPRTEIIFRHPTDDLSNLEPETWAEITFGDGWCLAGHFMLRKERVVLAELRIFPAEDRESTDPKFEIGEWSGHAEVVDSYTTGITARVLRSVPLAGLIDAMRVGAKSEAPLWKGPKLRKLAGKLAEPSQRSGRAGRPDLFYAVWAARYVDKVGSRTPVSDLAREDDLKQEQVRDILHQARVRGMLTRGSQGRAQGTLTPRAIELLEGANARKARTHGLDSKE